MGNRKGIAGFILAGLACGDATAERARHALTPSLRARVDEALAGLAALESHEREAWLRAADILGPPASQARLAASRELRRALAALDEPMNTSDELALLAEAGWHD